VTCRKMNLLRLKTLFKNVSVHWDTTHNRLITVKKYDSINKVFTEYNNLQYVHRKCSPSLGIHFQQPVNINTNDNTLLLQYVHGKDLFQFLKKTKNIEYTNIMNLIGSGIRKFQNQNMVHLDLKPENIIIHPIRGITFIDFFSLQKEIISSKCYTPSTSFGTLYYMSPEMYFDNRFHKNTDLWSLGLIGFMLSERFHPFQVQGVTYANMREYVGESLTAQRRDDKYILDICDLLHNEPNRRINRFKNISEK